MFTHEVIMASNCKQLKYLGVSRKYILTEINCHKRLIMMNTLKSWLVIKKRFFFGFDHYFGPSEFHFCFGKRPKNG